LIPNLRMHPFNTTLMGVLKGVADYFGITVSDAWLFGGSGHAFLINIHEQLCPSGPYVWNRKSFNGLVKNLGIGITELGFYSAKSTPEERKKVEDILRNSIDAGSPCSLLNMENQLISGYDGTRFKVEQPWPKFDFPPKTLTFQTWEELGDEVHVDFFKFNKAEKADDRTIITDGLSAALDMVKDQEGWREEHYYVGLQAYDTWIKAVGDGFGAIHGNWWNGMVWSECRRMASTFFSEIASKHQGKISEQATLLSTEYRNIAELLDKAKEKKLADDEKIRALQQAKNSEQSCIRGIEELLRII